MKNKMKHHSLKQSGVGKFSYIFLAIMSVVFIFPMFLAIMVSITSQDSIRQFGFQIIPTEFSLEAYRMLLDEYGSSLLRSMTLTVGTGIIQPILSIILTVCMAYPLSQPDFKGRDFWRKYLVVTMLFSGGLIPTYILYIKNAVSLELLPVQGQTMSLADIEHRLVQLDEQFQRLLAEAIDAEDKESCNAQFAEILAEQIALKKQKETILQSSADADRVCTRMKQAEEAIENAASTITEWNENAVRQIVERVTVLSADEILVRIKGGAEIKQRLVGK